MPDGDIWTILGMEQGFDPAGLAHQPLILLIGLMVEAVIGGMPRLWRRVPHPVALLGRLIALFDRRLNREDRSDAVRRLRGVMVTTVLTLLAALIGFLIQNAARAMPFGWVIELAIIVILMASRSLFDHVRAVARALDAGGLAAGRAAVRHIVGRDVEKLDEYGVARAAIESGAENFNDAVVAPSFWYLLLGLPGLLFYKTVNTMDSMIGYRTPRHRDFGMMAARFDDVLSFIPARLAALMIVLAASFTPNASPLRAWRVVLRDARKHASPNSGWPEAAMAGALNLALAGPRPYHGELKPAPWIGNGVARVTPTDIRRALYLYAVACVINMGWVAMFVYVAMLASR